MRRRESRCLELVIMCRQAIINEMCAFIHWIIDDQKRVLSQYLKNVVFRMFFQYFVQIQSSLKQLLEAHENTCSLFGVLCELESLDYNEIVAAAAKLVAEYKDYLNQTIRVELVQFAAFFTHFPEDEKIERDHFLCKLLMNKNVADTFPNVEIML